MDTRRDHSRTEADRRSGESCRDALRFRLEGEDGRHRFESVWFRGANGRCPDDLAEIAQMLEGRWLDEIDIETLKSMQSQSNLSRRCLHEVAEVVADIQEMLLEERRPRAGDVHAHGRTSDLGHLKRRVAARLCAPQEGTT